MEVLGSARTSLRAFLLQAAATSSTSNQLGLREALQDVSCPELRRLLHETVVYHYYKGAPAYPKAAWSLARSLQLSEVIMLVIERLLVRRRADPSDSNLLTLGYREVAPGSHGHRVATTNSVMCYFPNTLVATLKTAIWELLHTLIGDDLLVHLLLNYCIFMRVSQPNGSYIQLAGNSIRWMKRSIEEPISGRQRAKKKRKTSGNQAPARSAPSTISINHVMYARHFQKRKIFARSNLFTTTDGLNDNYASRGRASKLICSIFPEVKDEKRLPKRLVNLVPIIQEMLQRIRATEIDALISKLLPTPPELLSFLRDHRHVRDIILSDRVGQSSTVSTSGGTLQQIEPLMCKVAEEGYASQSESPMSFDTRKRKRRGDTVESLSSNSGVVSGERKPKRKVRFEGDVPDEARVDDETEPQLGVSHLAQLQRHRAEIVRLLQITVPRSTVRRVARKVLSTIVPKSLFGPATSGSPSHDTNWGKVKVLIDRLVTSRRYDILCLDRIASGFRVKSIHWMNASGKSTCPPNELQTRQKLVTQMLKWITSEVLFPVLRNCFYITECEGSANDVFFYSRPVWTTISKLALYDLTSHILRPTTAVELSLASRQLGASRLRLLPKISGVRPLMNLSGKSLDMNNSVNRSLELVHRALLFEIERQSSRLLGATVRNVDEIHMKLKDLQCNIRECSCCGRNEDRKLYCVTVDVERCFDTIRPKKLLRMLKQVFAEEEYLVRKHWVCKGSYYKMERPAFPSGELKSYQGHVEDVGKKRDAVFVDGVLYDYISKAKILALLREHLTGNTVQADDSFYTQKQGIPQGSVLSTTLCNLYYAHFEKRVIRKCMGLAPSVHADQLPCSHELLMRYTDDFLFISTDIQRARCFAELMHHGNEEYGCFVNPKKSRVNFPVVTVNGTGEIREIPRFDDPAVSLDSDFDASGTLLAWCGILLDPVSFQIYVNYEKLGLSAVAASIPMDDTKNVGGVFVNKVISAIRQRWHRIYFDTEMLDPSTIQINVYQMMCLAALRFVLLVDKLPAASSVSFLHGCMKKIIFKTSRGIRGALSEHNTEHHSEMDNVVWLTGLHSFIAVISTIKLSSSNCSRSPEVARSHVWHELLKKIRRDLSDQRARHSRDRKQTLTAPRFKLLTPTELRHDPRNAVVCRWTETYRGRHSSTA